MSQITELDLLGYSEHQLFLMYLLKFQAAPPKLRRPPKSGWDKLLRRAIASGKPIVLEELLAGAFV